MAGETNYAGSFTFNAAAIGDCFVISYPSITAGKVDATTHQSTGGKQEQLPNGRIYYGDMTLSVMVETGTLIALEGFLAAKTVDTCVIVDGIDTYTFEGFFIQVDKEQADSQSPDMQKVTVGLAPAGAIVISATP